VSCKLDFSLSGWSIIYKQMKGEGKVSCSNGQSAAVYVSSHGVAGRKPSERYLNLLLEGAREHELPADYIRTLEAFDLAVDERSKTAGDVPKATKA